MSIGEQDIVRLQSESGIAGITLNRPESLNALNPDLLATLERTFDELAKDQNLRVVTLTGAGPKAFVAGADISSMNSYGPRGISEYLELGQRVMRKIELLPVPVLALVNGYALGGGLELALACDIIIASDTAKLGQPEVNLGIIPGFGGTQRLIGRCGVGEARRLCYTGDLITGEEAKMIGLADKVVPQATLLEEGLKMAKTIAEKAPLAIRGCKKVIRRSEEARLLSGLRLEVEEFQMLFATVDRAEGMDAFLAKRAAKFVGK